MADRKVLIDVGAHDGQTIEAAIDPLFGFDRIFSFEPAPPCWPTLELCQDSRVVVVRAGLLDDDRVAPLFSAGTLGASVHADHPYSGTASVEADFIDVAKFMKLFVSPTARVFVKLNCEGSELEIVNRLISSEQIARVEAMLIDFDAAKIPSRRAALDEVKTLLFRNALGPTLWHTPEQVMYHQQSHFGGIRNWLIVAGAAETGARRQFASALFHGCNLARGRHRGYYAFRAMRGIDARLPGAYANRVKPVLDRIRGRMRVCVDVLGPSWLALQR